MSEPSANRDPSDLIQTVGQLKNWLKAFSDDHSVLGAIEDQPRVNCVQCRHAEGYVIIKVPRLRPRS